MNLADTRSAAFDAAFASFTRPVLRYYIPIVIVTTILFIAAVVLWKNPPDLSGSPSAAAAIGLFLAIVKLAFLAWFMRFRGIKLRALFKRRSDGRAVVDAAIAGAMLVALAFPSMYVLWMSVDSVSPGASSAAFDVYFPGAREENVDLTVTSISLDAVTLCIILPVFEELAFRGLLFGRLLRRSGVTTSAVVVSAVFAVLHYDMIGKFVMSMVLCYALLRTGSLFVPIVCHAFNNAIALSIIPLEPWLSSETALHASTIEIIYDPRLAIAGAVVLLVIWGLLRLSGRRLFRPPLEE